jgi:hypothetical protein
MVLLLPRDLAPRGEAFAPSRVPCVDVGMEKVLQVRDLVVPRLGVRRRGPDCGEGPKDELVEI